eukprot:1287467-Rhodomonas_salina.2
MGRTRRGAMVALTTPSSARDFYSAFFCLSTLLYKSWYKSPAVLRTGAAPFVPSSQLTIGSLRTAAKTASSLPLLADPTFFVLKLWP